MLTTSLPRFRKEIQFALGLDSCEFVLCPFRSLLLRVSLIYFTLIVFPKKNYAKIIVYFLFRPVLRCFNSRRFLLSQGDSEISGSKLACSSPKLIAACHVFHRNQNQAIHLTASVIVCPSKFSNQENLTLAYLIEHETLI